MENYEMNSTSDNSQMKQHYQRFAEQLSDWYCDGKTPGLASQDTRFTLELQKQKLRSLGLDMQVQFRKPDKDDGRVAVLYYGDSVFTNSIICAGRHITTKISNSGKEIFSSDAEGGLTIIMQDPKEGGVPSLDTAMCCPNCGAPSTLGKLESGCEFCDTKFLMDELYPKVMHFFIQEDGKELFDTKKLKKLIVLLSIIFLAVSVVIMVINMPRMQPGLGRLLYEIAGRTVASIMLGGIIGGAGWFIANTVGSVMLLGKNTRGTTKAGKSLIFCHDMHTLDPTFSIEYFRDKSMSLLKFMLYSQDPQELSICQCKRHIPERLREILDTTYFNSGVDSYSIRDGVCDVTLTFYTDSLHYRSGIVFRESDKIRMSLRKVIKKPTDLGFSFTAVTCPSCSASFDAAKVRNCPFCGNAYPIEENEWVVTDICI